MYYIWYYYVDLDKTWLECKDAFMSQFPSIPREVGGLRSGLYRFLRTKKCPAAAPKGQKVTKAALLEYSVVGWCKMEFSWMRPEHRPSEEPTCESKTVYRYVT
jgi:hypothetical protein